MRGFSIGIGIQGKTRFLISIMPKIYSPYDILDK
jgi:hypothetical protein